MCVHSSFACDAYILYTVGVAPLFYHVLPAVATPYTCDAVDLFCPVLGVFCDATPPQSAAAATPLTNNSRINCAGSTVAQVRPTGTSGNRLYKLTTYMEFVWGEVSVNVPIFFDYVHHEF